MNINKEWSLFLNDYFESNDFFKLENFIDKEYSLKTIFPEYDNIFNAFNLLTPKKVKVVILGQDPYHGINQANGLAFSVCDECKVPPSLHNIFKELADDLNVSVPNSGNLTTWSQEGVLLMNTVLTVEDSKANSHKDMGWEIMTDKVIQELSFNFESIVFILWGAYAQKKSSLIDSSKHFIIKSPHPSPLSSYRGFFGSKPFSKTNEYLRLHNIKEIDWSLN